MPITQPITIPMARPDVLLPANGLTLAILRDQAMVIASPAAASASPPAATRTSRS